MPKTPDRPAPGGTPADGPASFLAAAAALNAIDRAVHAAGTPPTDRSAPLAPGSDAEPGSAEQALAALVLLREIRAQLAGWEAGLVETARSRGATWADLAHPMGVASRQAAETRYLRLKPPTNAEDPPATGAERVRAERDRRAVERTVTTWARANAADLRLLAAQADALTGLGLQGRQAVQAVRTALGSADAADLVAPLTALRPHLGPGHAELTDGLDTLAGRLGRLRRAGAPRRTRP